MGEGSCVGEGAGVGEVAKNKFYRYFIECRAIKRVSVIN